MFPGTISFTSFFLSKQIFSVLLFQSLIVIIIFQKMSQFEFKMASLFFKLLRRLVHFIPSPRSAENIGPICKASENVIQTSSIPLEIRRNEVVFNYFRQFLFL